jgi:hypothetical protein
MPTWHGQWVINTHTLITIIGFYTPGQTVFLTCGKTTIFWESSHTCVKTMDLLNGYCFFPELDADLQCCASFNLGDELKSVPNMLHPKFCKGRAVSITHRNWKQWSLIKRVSSVTKLR